MSIQMQATDLKNTQKLTLPILKEKEPHPDGTSWAPYSLTHLHRPLITEVTYALLPQYTSIISACILLEAPHSQSFGGVAVMD